MTKTKDRTQAHYELWLVAEPTGQNVTISSRLVNVERIRFPRRH